MDYKRTSSAYRVALILLMSACGLLAAACNPLPPINYEFSPPPTEWIPERSEEGTLLFRRENPPMGIMVNTQCDRHHDVPLDPLSRTLFIGFENRVEISREEATVDGHEAVAVVMECTLEDTPLKIKSYTFKAGGCIYDVVYFARPGDFEDGLPYFEEFVRNFRADG